MYDVQTNMDETLCDSRSKTNSVLVSDISVRNEVVPVIYIVVFTKECVGWGRVNLLCGHDLRTCDYIQAVINLSSSLQ